MIVAANKPEASTPIVGVGASAGGLPAFQALLRELPANTGFAFVLVQHLDPTHPSELADILSRSTSMPVQDASNGDAPKPNRVYVAPSGATLVMQNGVFHLIRGDPANRSRHPIDQLFESLAQSDEGTNVGVVLTGTGTDGTLGLAALRAAGGMTVVQDPSTAEFPDMPQSALANGCAELALPLEEIASHIARLGGEAHRDSGSASEDDEAHFSQILANLQLSLGVDFREYRSSTIHRRIRRRALLQSKSIAEYARILEGDANERKALYQDLLINVTHFFRDPDVFDALNVQALAVLFKNKPKDQALRVWVPACSSGQEVYSLAISLVEATEKMAPRPVLQLFGTDVNEAIIEKARRGWYDARIAEEVKPERLQRFFTKTDRGYQVSKSIRDLCVFARHNLLADPPFAQLDMVSCRNLLIYFSPALQDRVIPIFHYALRDPGFLILGSAETVSATQLFKVVDSRNRIYARRPGRAALPPPRTRPPITPGDASERLPPDDISQTTDRILIRHYAPPGVLVNENFEILKFIGRTRSFLDLPVGKATYDLFKMAPDVLARELRTALTEAKKQARPVNRTNVQFRVDQRVRTIDLKVLPIPQTGNREPFYLILFEEGKASPSRSSSQTTTGPSPDDVREVDLLRRELAALKESFQATIEQQTSLNDELRATSEEATASNEELQSTNEELESAKEELHASNEELSTLNQELQNRNREIQGAREYLDAIVHTIRQPLLVAGSDFKVRTASPSFLRTFLLDEKETLGRDFFSIGEGEWDIPELRTMLTRVIHAGDRVEDVEIQKTFRSLGPRSLLVSARRLQGLGTDESFVLLGIDDVTQRRAVQALEREATALRAAVREAESFSYMVSHDLRTPLRSIAGYAEILRKDYTTSLDAKGQEAVHYIEKAANGMRMVTEGLLQLSRITRSDLNLQPVDVSLMAREILDDLQSRDPGRVVKTIVQDGMVVNADSTLLRILLSNLLENAWKYTGTRPVAGIEVGLQASGFPVLFVRDNGVGFDMTEAPKLFHAFERLHKPEDFEGTGIGLATVRRIAERHKGSVWAEGAVDRGATFFASFGRRPST